MNDLKRCYEILEIGPESTYEEARTAFRDMVSIWHPDKFQHSSRLRQKAEEKIKLINAAWEQLQGALRPTRDGTEETSGKELVVVSAHSSGERKPRQREGKTSGPGCYLTDLDFEPLVDVEQARKAYRHRFQRCGFDPGCFAGAGGDCGPDGAGTECLLSGEDGAVTEECATSGTPGHESAGADCPHRRSEGDASTVSPAREHWAGSKGAAKGQRDHQHFPEELVDESGRKVKLLTDSYWLGFLERKFANWQQREREHRKQRDSAKEIARKDKILAERYLGGFKTWLAKEKAKHRPSPIIGGLFKKNSAPGGEKRGKFLFGVPDISLTFIKGGSFLAGNDPRSCLGGARGGNSVHHYRVVAVSDCYIGREPVTVRQWSKVMGVEAAGAEADLPVLLTWEGAHDFIARLNEITGLKFRVPTDAEWQYAARCGARDELRHGLADAGSIRAHFSSAGRRAAGQHKAGAPGHIDMSGSGGEWVTGTPQERLLRKGREAAHGGAAVSGQSFRGAVQRDAHGNIQVFHAPPSNLKAADRRVRFSFRLAHAAC